MFLLQIQLSIPSAGKQNLVFTGVTTQRCELDIKAKEIQLT